MSKKSNDMSKKSNDHAHHAGCGCAHDPRCAGVEAAHSETIRNVNDPAVGWQVLAILAQPPFSYTVGLYRNFQQPELVAFGLRPEIAHAILNAVGFHFKQGGTIEPGQPDNRFTEQYPAIFLPVDKQNYDNYFGTAQWYYTNDEFPVMQMVWPDPAGRFPWESGFEHRYDSLQPALYGKSALHLLPGYQPV